MRDGCEHARSVELNSCVTTETVTVSRIKGRRLARPVPSPSSRKTASGQGNELCSDRHDAPRLDPESAGLQTEQVFQPGRHTEMRAGEGLRGEGVWPQGGTSLPLVQKGSSAYTTDLF